MMMIDIESLHQYLPQILSNYLNWTCKKDYVINEKIDPEFYMREQEPQLLLLLINNGNGRLDFTTVIDGIADKLPYMDIARGCISGYLIGLLGERKNSTQKSSIALLDHFLRIVDLCISFNKIENKSIDNLIKNHLDEYKASLEMPTLSTAVMSRITKSREYRDYLRSKPDIHSKISSLTSYGNVSYIPNILNMAEKETIIFLHLELNKGCEVEIEEMSNNFEMFTWFQMELYHNNLLKDYGITNFEYNELIDNAIHRKDGKNLEYERLSTFLFDKAYFNYYQYSARYINKEDQVKYNDFEIVCGEGNIYEVPKLNDKFIILLTSTNKNHCWNGGNIIGDHINLSPKLKIIRELNENEILEWKSKINST